MIIGQKKVCIYKVAPDLDKNVSLQIKGKMLDDKFGVCAARLYNNLDPTNKDHFTIGPEKMEANR